MKIYKFETNINCGGCIASVTPFLDGEKRIESWEADTANPKKILTVQAEMDEKEIIALLETAGFTAKRKKRGLFG